MKIVFMGTPDFAVPNLQSLINSEHEVVGVFTQTDKPKGRGYVLTAPPVKELALKYNIPVFQPKTLKNNIEVLEILKELCPDVIVVVAYGKILPKEIIEFPKYGCINVHGSLLPKYRGAAPIQWAVINGEKKSGVTTMYMDEGLDTGDMILKAETEIGENETAGELYDRLSLMGADLLIETIKAIEGKSAKREKQNDEESTYAHMLTKELCLIDWNKPSDEVHNLIRGLNSWPIAITMFKGKRLKIYKSRISSLKGKKPGEIVSVYPLVVSCKDNSSIELTEVQAEGKKRMSAEDFARGHRLEKEMMFGG